MKEMVRMGRVGRLFFVDLICFVLLFPAIGSAASSLAMQGFYEAAFRGEYGDTGRATTVRWTQPITIYIKGDYTRGDVATVSMLLYDLSCNVQNLPQLSLTTKPEGANVTMSFVPYEKMDEAVTGYEEGNVGFVWVNYDNYDLTSAEIAISSTNTSQKTRSAVIREEIVNMLGLLNDITCTRKSIICQDGKTVTDLSSIDYEMLNLLYGPLMPPGTTRKRAGEILGN
jgi:hypothetical protein